LHAWSIRDYAAKCLSEVVHCNGKPACVLYGPPPGTGPADVGPTLTFNLLNRNREVMGHHAVGRAAAACGLELRWGAFCNRGGLRAALEAVHGTCPELLDPCWQPSDVVASSQSQLNGAIRASFGFASSFDDVKALVSFVNDFVACEGRLDIKSQRSKRWKLPGVFQEGRDSANSLICRRKNARQRKRDASQKRRHCEVQSCKGACEVQSCQDAARKRVKLHASAEFSICKQEPSFSTPGERDALPDHCGAYEARLQAGLAHPDAFSAIRARSISGMCWYLHDRRHEHSVEEESVQSVFGGSEAQGRTALMIASAMGLLEFVDVLINYLGADVNHASSTDGDTALHRAACKGHPAVCERLLSAGAKVFKRIKSGSMVGWTAKDVAQWKASGDRSAHAKAHLADYHPVSGGSFEEAAAVLTRAEKETCHKQRTTAVLPNSIQQV